MSMVQDMIRVERLAQLGLGPEQIAAKVPLAMRTVARLVEIERAKRAAADKASEAARRERVRELNELAVSKFTVREIRLDGVRRSIAAIIHETAAKHEIGVSDVIGPSRKPYAIAARFEALYRCAAETGHSYEEMGRAMGGRDHKTVLHAIRQHAKRNDIPVPRVPEGAANGSNP